MLFEPFSFHNRTNLTGHSHQALHLCLVEAGEIEEQIGCDRVPLSGGSIRVSPAAIRHDLHIHSTGAVGATIELDQSCQISLTEPLSHSVFLDQERYQFTGRKLIDHWNRGERFEAECLALELAATAVAPERGEQPNWLTELRAEIDQESTERYSLSTLASRYGRHQAHVAKSFRAWYGRSIGAHLLASRIYQAEIRLQQTDQSIAAIALETGFYDQAHFSRLFKRYRAQSPARFRAMMLSP